MKNELRHVKLHLWRNEYDYKCNRYSLVTTTVAVKQWHVTMGAVRKNIISDRFSTKTAISAHI